MQRSRAPGASGCQRTLPLRPAPRAVAAHARKKREAADDDDPLTTRLSTEVLDALQERSREFVAGEVRLPEFLRRTGPPPPPPVPVVRGKAVLQSASQRRQSRASTGTSQQYFAAIREREREAERLYFTDDTRCVSARSPRYDTTLLSWGVCLQDRGGRRGAERG